MYCFTAGEENVEIINAMTGKAEQGTASRLCKQSMFRHFVNLLDKLPRPNSLPENVRSELYSTLKAKAEDYQVCLGSLCRLSKQSLSQQLNYTD